MNPNDARLNEGSLSVMKIIKIVGVLLALFLLVLVLKGFKEIRYVGRDVPAMTTITVAGHGEEVAIPDIAKFTFSVIEEAKTVDEARTKATEKINKVIAVLESNKVDKDDMKTVSYNINPLYDYIQPLCVYGRPCTSGKQTLRGYEVSQSLEIKVREVEKVGALFTAVSGAGVTNVSSLQFSIDDDESIKAVAREEAVKDARAKAEVLARSLGVDLVRIVGFSENSGGYYPVPMYYAKDMAVEQSAAGNAAPRVPTGEQDIVSDVMVTYEIR